MEEMGSTPTPHVLIFPLPLQGPVKCMLNLAELLCLAGGIHVTFLNTHHIHRLLLRHTRILSRFQIYPQFRFQTLSDGLPNDHPRSGDRLMELIDGLQSVTKPLFREMLITGGGEGSPPVTCIIADGALTFGIGVAEQVGIPLIYFDTISPCGLWTYFCVPKLIDAGEIPFEGNDLDALIENVPGMERFLRGRDLPSFCRTTNLNDQIINFAMMEAKEVPRSAGLILNTFEELDAPILYHMRSLCPNLYAIGPLHTHLKMRLPTELKPQPASSYSLWQEDLTCMAWLDKQPPKSVIYVSIGSLAMMTGNQLMEIWHGLVKSGHRFLWVRRPNSISGENLVGRIPMELLKATEERGCIVSWSPQEKVLAHPAIGGFFTHSGWNSTLESITEEVPMICWPYFVDQHVNSRFVSEVWRIGIDMKDTCDRVVIESTIKDLMEVRRDEFLNSVNRFAKLARESVTEEGSSYRNLKCLIEDIRLMKV